MKVATNAISIIVAVTLTSMFGLALGAVFGWVSGSLVPGIFVADDMPWNSSEQLYAAIVFCAGGGTICGGCLGAFAVAVQALLECRRGN